MSADKHQEMRVGRERLLTTREAAAFLKVSEASIRRWTDSGLLPAHRVGRRRARRLREEDLRQFMEAGPGQGSAAADTSSPSTIIIQDVVVSLGSHLAAFYTSDAGRLRLGLPLMRDGLLAGQTVVLRARPDVREHYFAALRNEGIDAAEAVGSGLLMIYPPLWMLSSSFKPGQLIFSEPGLWPREITFDNWAASSGVRSPAATARSCTRWPSCNWKRPPVASYGSRIGVRPLPSDPSALRRGVKIFPETCTRLMAVGFFSISVRRKDRSPPV